MERIEFKRVNLIEGKRTKIAIEADVCGVHIVSVEERYDSEGNLRYKNLDECVYSSANGKVDVKFMSEESTSDIEPSCVNVTTILGLL